MLTAPSVDNMVKSKLKRLPERQLVKCLHIVSTHHDCKRLWNSCAPTVHYQQRRYMTIQHRLTPLAKTPSAAADVLIGRRRSWLTHQRRKHYSVSFLWGRRCRAFKAVRHATNKRKEQRVIPTFTMFCAETPHSHRGGSRRCQDIDSPPPNQPWLSMSQERFWSLYKTTIVFSRFLLPLNTTPGSATALLNTRKWTRICCTCVLKPQGTCLGNQ